MIGLTSPKLPVGDVMTISESSRYPLPFASIWTPIIDPPIIIGLRRARAVTVEIPTSGLLWKSMILVQP